jgi:putative ABC transport system ATP-binding protein
MGLFFPSWTLDSIGLLALLLHCSIALQLGPSAIGFRAVSQSYEDTLFRKLFSSVPRREFALKDISFDVESGDFLVILGASSSGKSTILRLLGTEQPVSGNILLQSTSTPIYLDCKPTFNNKQTIETILFERCEEKELVVEICDLVDLDMTKKPSDLTPSETYKYGLVEACMKSVAFTEPCAPILLLDEWMDLETSVVVQKVEKTILKLTEGTGAIVLCVTHKPNLFRSSHECITMCRGEILSRGQT